MAVKYEEVRRLSDAETRWLANVEIQIDRELREKLATKFVFTEGVGYTERTLSELRVLYSRAGWNVEFIGGNYGKPTAIVINEPPQEAECVSARI